MTALILLLLAAPAKSTPAASSKSSSPSLPNRAAVFVLPKDDGATAVAGRTEAALLKALESNDVTITSLDTLFAAPERENVGARHLKAGQEAFENLDLEAAAKKYDEALAWFTQHPELADSKELSHIHLFLASVALGQGKSGQKKAREEMERALVFSPDATLDPKYFGPDAKKIWEKARLEVANRPTAKLSIESTPTAEVTFQGAVVKDSPSVSVGRHLVTFKRPGYLPAGVLVDVFKDGGSAKVKLEPIGDYALVRTQLEAVVPASFGAAKAPPGAKTIATAVKSRFLVLGSMGSTGGELEVWDGETLNVLKDVALGTTDSGANR